MTTVLSKMLGVGILFLLIFLSGFWLSRAGRPYPVLLFTLHKLIAVGAAVLFALAIAQVHRALPLQTAQWAALALTGLCLAAAIVTGGLASLEKTLPAGVRIAHHVLPYLTVLGVGVTLVLALLRGGLAPA